jgi:L-asparaginase II
VLDLQTFAEMCGYPVGKIAVGIDGCSAPVWGLPLRAAALAYARLVDPAGLLETRAAACRRIVEAMTTHPDMVQGPDGFDTLLMQLGRGRLVVKGGAEGYMAIGVLPEPGRRAHGLGITMKISDGNDDRARQFAALEVLRQLNVLSADEIASLPRYGSRTVTNQRGLLVGEARPCFHLRFGEPRWKD